MKLSITKLLKASRGLKFFSCFFTVFLGVSLFLAQTAQAHAPSWSVETEAAPIILRFTYTDGKPMSFSKVRVLSPDGEIYQVGNADREGYFSFIPRGYVESTESDSAPLWTVLAIGDEGHEIKAEVSAEASTNIQSRQSSMSSALAWLLVVSVLNFAFLGAKLERLLSGRSSGTPSNLKA